MHLAEYDQPNVAEYFRQNDPPEVNNQSVDNLINTFIFFSISLLLRSLWRGGK